MLPQGNRGAFPPRHIAIDEIHFVYLLLLKLVIKLTQLKDIYNIWILPLRRLLFFVDGVLYINEKLIL